MPCQAHPILQDLQARAQSSTDREALGAFLVQALKAELPAASWVGIYWLQGSSLHLGPFVGPETEHTEIPVGRGVCGTAVAEDRDQVVEDVSTLDNYLSCAAGVRSEIVVLIRSAGRVLGQIDVDSEEVGAFGESEHCVLRTLADAFGALIQPDQLDAVGDASSAS